MVKCIAEVAVVARLHRRTLTLTPHHPHRHPMTQKTDGDAEIMTGGVWHEFSGTVEIVMFVAICDSPLAMMTIVAAAIEGEAGMTDRQTG